VANASAAQFKSVHRADDPGTSGPVSTGVFNPSEIVNQLLFIRTVLSILESNPFGGIAVLPCDFGGKCGNQKTDSACPAASNLGVFSTSAFIHESAAIHLRTTCHPTMAR